jgi:hypothetical protein
VLGATQDISALDAESRRAWLEASGFKMSVDRKDTADDGETFDFNKPKNPKNSKSQPDTKEIEQKENAKIRQSMTLLFEKFHLFQIATECRTVEDILGAIQKDQDHTQAFKESFNIEIDILLKDIKAGAINTRSLEMSLK